MGIWPRWLTGNEFTATISLYTNNGVIVNWVRELRRRHRHKPKPKPEAKPKPEPKPVANQAVKNA